MNSDHKIRYLFLPLCVAALAGCARSERLPAYRWVDSPTALADLAARARSVHSISAQCDIMLTRPDGQSVRLEGALAMMPPASVRLRAWKLGQAVFDLTLNADGVWIVLPDDPDQKQHILPAGANAAKMARAWAALSGEFFLSGQARMIDTGGPRVLVEHAVDGQPVTCEIDRATLTPRLYSVRDPSGASRFTLAEDRYAIIGGIPWPTRLIAQSDGGTIELQLHDVELNGELPAGALIPPSRAQKLP